MNTRNTKKTLESRTKSVRTSRLASFGVLFASVILLHCVVFTSLDVLIPIEDGASPEIALVVEDTIKPMDLLVDAR